jgi:isoleucyl-tRNA synthetase
MVFTCEEAWEQRYPGANSVHLQQFPQTPDGWLNAGVAAKWDAIFKVRKAVTEALEVERREKRIGSSLEATVAVSVGDASLLEAFAGEDAAEIFITSGANLVAGGEGITVRSSRAGGVKCARSWKYFDPATADPAFPDITPRDAVAVREYRGF